MRYFHSPEDEQLVQNLQSWAAEYADSSNGRMIVLPHDPELYPAQAPDCISITAKPVEAWGAIDSVMIDSVAVEAQDKYPALQADLQQQESTSRCIEMTGELLSGGNSVIVTTNHGDLIDVAVAHAAVYSELARRGYDAKTGIIISKMISYLAYKIRDDYMPCTDVLKVLEQDIFLSYPKTNSAKKHLKDRIIRPRTESHNKRVRAAIAQKLGEGGVLLAMAASGTTDKLIDGDPHHVLIGQLATGTDRIMEANRTYILPIGVWYAGDHRVLRAVDMPRRIGSNTTPDNIMNNIANRLTEATGDTEFVYEGRVESNP